MRCCGGWMSAWMGAWMFFLSLAFVSLLILSGVLVWALRKRGATTAPRPPAAEGLDNLARRNDRDEPDHQEVEERRQAPESHRSGAS
jgi:hypothetical protein